MPQPFLYSVEREYAASIERVWAAWTDAAQLETWYHPTDLRALPGATVSELREGGLWATAVDVPAFGFVAYFYGQYTQLMPRERIEHTLHYTQSPEEFAARDFTTPSHDIVIEFAARGDRTWVKFSQFGELPEGQVERTQAGMESYFDSLAAFLG